MICLFFICRSSKGGEASELFDKMLDRYQQVSALTSAGSMESSSKASPVGARKAFSLSFVRPDQFDLEIVEQNPFSKKTTTSRVFILQGKAYSQIDPDVKPKEEASLYEALRSARGASWGMSEFIPYLLLGTNVFIRGVAEQLPDAEVDGVKCLHFNALTVKRQPVEVFFDRNNLAIIKLQRTAKLNSPIPTGASEILRKVATNEVVIVITSHHSKFDW